MNTSELEQGSRAWHEARLGHVTASRIADVMTKPRKGRTESSTRANYRAQLICEILTGNVEDEYQTWEMKRGIELEPQARIEYELRKNVNALTTGFIKHATIPRYGASPDVLIGEDGMAQIKCPNKAKHLEWIRAGIVPVEHRPQMHSEMSCTGRMYDDFVSYHPEFPDHLQLFVVRLVRDDVEIAEIEAAVQRFNAEIDAIIAGLPTRDGETALESQLRASIAMVSK